MIVRHLEIELEELFRKMGSVYPILEKEEPPENKPEKGGQEEEPGQDKDKEKDKEKDTTKD